METQIYPSVVSIFRENYVTQAEYKNAVEDCKKHYGYKARVEGGWKFFEFENDFAAWKNQK